MVLATLIVCAGLWWFTGKGSGALGFLTWLGIALGVSLIPGGVALWAYLGVRADRYELTSERLLISEGVFTRKSESVELYRVRDIVIEEPFLYRMVGVGTIVLLTSDLSAPKIVLPAIKNATEFREIARKHIEAIREKKNVRQMDIDQQQV
jgi:uncharacterized membrane protein YdbT with pleckstrin-like domain